MNWNIFLWCAGFGLFFAVYTACAILGTVQVEKKYGDMVSIAFTLGALLFGIGLFVGLLTGILW